MLAPSGRTADLIAGRRALEDGANGEVIAVGRRCRFHAVAALGCRSASAPTSPSHFRAAGTTSSTVRARLPSLSYVALRDSHALAVASFFSPERLGYPPGKAQRAGCSHASMRFSPSLPRRLRRRRSAFPATTLTPLGIDTELFHPVEKRDVIVCEWRPGERLMTKALYSIMKELPGWDLTLLRTKALAGRPSVPPLFAAASTSGRPGRDSCARRS